MGVFGMTDQLRDAAGAADGTGGGAILTSGGALAAGARAITGSDGTADGGTVRRLVTSGATDAVSDIVTKATGGTDPNPGHTTDQQASTSSADPAPPAPTPSQSQKSDPIGQALGKVGSLSDTKLAGIAAAGVAVAVIGGK